MAGYPDAETSFELAVATIDAGADILEIGLPYSDPLADGTTLQRASHAALQAGSTLDGSLALVRRVARARPGIPLVTMGYANQLIGGGDGRERAARLVEAGAAGVIVADMTPDEGAPFEAAAADAGLAVVYLVAPTTRPERRAAIAARSGGFLYCVSLVGVTGARSTLARRVGRLVKEVKAVSPVPVAVGFGVSRPAHVRDDREGRRRRGRGRLGARRRARPRRPGRAAHGTPRSIAPRGDRHPGLTYPRRVPKSKKVTVGVEVTPKKAFASALEWPGWSRAGKTPEDAVAALAAYADRYAAVAKRAKLDFPFDADGAGRRRRGDGRATPRPQFGIPDVRFKADGRRTTTKDGEQLAAIVDAAWKIFDRIVAGAPAELRKGPRGGGRDRDKIVEHVVGADGGYARVLGLKGTEVDPRDRAAVADLRKRMLEAIRAPSDGSPIAGKKWPPRYAARRVAWHALDHAWEIEDRSDPEG